MEAAVDPTIAAVLVDGGAAVLVDGGAVVLARPASAPEPEHAPRPTANSNTLDRRRHVLDEPIRDSI